MCMYPSIIPVNKIFQKRVLIVEDHEDMQFIYNIILRKLEGITIIGMTSTAIEALEKISTEIPDIAIIDISLPGMDGLELTEKLKNFHPEIKVLIATGHSQEAYYEPAMKAGADDFMVKGNAQELIKKVMQLSGFSTVPA
jgi:two-component system, response regulator YesN